MEVLSDDENSEERTSISHTLTMDLALYEDCPSSELDPKIFLRKDDPIIGSNPEFLSKVKVIFNDVDYQWDRIRDFSNAWNQRFTDDWIESHDDGANDFSGVYEIESKYPYYFSEVEKEKRKETERQQYIEEERESQSKEIVQEWRQDIFQPLKIKSLSSHIKPRLSFTSLIALAINSINKYDGISVQEIYRYIGDRFPHFHETPIVNWRNSIRHNLSHSGVFCKSKFHRTAKKGYNWKIKPGSARKLQMEVKKYRFIELGQIKHALRGPVALNELISMGFVSKDLQNKLKRKN